MKETSFKERGTIIKRIFYNVCEKINFLFSNQTFIDACRVPGTKYKIHSEEYYRVINSIV